MSAISGDLLSDNINVMEEKKMQHKQNRKSTQTNMFTVKNFKKITRVTLKVFMSIAMLFLGGSIFWYYGIICHAGLLQTEFPHDYYERSVEPDAPQSGFDKIKILKTQVPIYSMEDNNNTTRCSFVHFNEADINEQFEGTVNSKGKQENASLLYKLTEIKEGAEKQGTGFIKYSFINYVQRLIIADFKIISTYFEFFHSVCNESVGLMLGALFLIPFVPIYLICHVVSSMGLFLMSMMDIFKTGHYDPSKHQPDVSAWSQIWYIFFPADGSTEPTPEYEPLEWRDIFVRLGYLFFYGTMGTIVGIVSSIFCALYSIAKVFAMKGSVDVPNSSANDSSSNPTKSKPFTMFHLLKNNLHFYSRGYLIAFTLMLINQIYTDMSPSTAIGCIFAVIILVFGTNVFAKYIVDPNDFTSSGDKCNASIDKETNADNEVQSQQEYQSVEPSAPPLFEEPQSQLVEPSAPPLFENTPINAVNNNAQVDKPFNGINNISGGTKHIKKSSSKTKRKKSVVNLIPQ